MSLVRWPLKGHQVPAREALVQLHTQQKRANDQLRQRGKVKIPYGMNMVVCSYYSIVYLTIIGYGKQKGQNLLSDENNGWSM
jgi:hypothetical protein